MIVDVLIIGAGPAGITAAIQLKRSGLEPFIVEKDCIGGALLNAGWVENYPGFSPGITGSDLVKIFEQHLAVLEIEVHPITVEELHLEGDQFSLRSSEGEIRTRAVVVATGCKPNRLGIPGEEELVGRSVFYELRDLPAEVGRFICIVGGGDAAFDYALSLARHDKDVAVVMRSEKPNCLPLLHQRASQHPRIRLVTNSEPLEFTENGEEVRIALRGDAEPAMMCHTVLVAVGREPNLDFLSPELRPPERTSLPIYYAGDVVNGSFRQVGIAVGDGLRCAMNIVSMFSESEAL
jgi:thioredoxin reductase (NADPH)